MTASCYAINARAVAYHKTILVSLEDEKHYTQIIDGILSTVDLETVTRKKIRSGLEAALGGKDLSDHKVHISPFRGSPTSVCERVLTSPPLCSMPSRIS